MKSPASVMVGAEAVDDSMTTLFFSAIGAMARTEVLHIGPRITGTLSIFMSFFAADTDC
ncbi:hypothetical protein ES703_54780 [subsurface metagenome]